MTKGGEVSAPDSLAHIREMPTVVNEVHESVYRSWHILHYVEWLLERETPNDVILALIRDMEAR